MNFSTIIGVALFLTAVILSQKITVNASAKLDDATKLKVIEVFRKRNLNYTIFIFAIVILFLAAIYLFPQCTSKITIAYAVVFACYILMKLILNVKKLKEIAAPPEYIRSVIISFGVFICGAVAAGIVIAVGNFALAY